MPILQAGEGDVVGFEPNRAALQRLNEMKGPNELYLPYSIGDGGRHTLHVCQAPGMTSLLQPNPEVLNLFHGFPEWGRVLSVETVETKRLDDIAETEGAELIKIDIQGGELMALSNGRSRLTDVLLIYTEVEFLPMYVGQPLFSEMEQFLRSEGFMFHRLFPAVTRVVRPLLVNNDIYAGMSQLFWADALFIRDITRLYVLSDVQLLKLGKILHDCYGSIDIVLRLLTEYDRRTGAALASAYLSGLTAHQLPAAA